MNLIARRPLFISEKRTMIYGFARLSWLRVFPLYQDSEAEMRWKSENLPTRLKCKCRQWR